MCSVLPITSIVRLSKLSGLSTFVLYTSLFIQPHKRKPEECSMERLKDNLDAKSKLLYNEIALSQKPLGIEYVYIYSLLFRMSDTVTS